ncbi:alpha-L-fucosidase [Pontiella sp.]|uniref:alpha-L-fucosidase n=1 Tax=Pontiella sp. TaxID=2837462 RepID=UPI00356AA060
MKKLIMATTVVLFSAGGLRAAEQRHVKVESSQERDARMAWWREARFGMFVHWGLYSIPAGEWNGNKWEKGGLEWIQKRANIPADVYEKALVPQFKPKDGFAEEWAKTAKMAGCKYLVFTSKHHEGFALHDSKQTTFDAMDACGRDLFKEIVDATKAEGLKVGAYHSVIDWHHPQAYAGFGLPTVKGVTNEGRDNSVYVDYLHKQVEEIVTGYGPIDVIWWDFSKPNCQGESWRAKELMALVRKHQPNILMNDRLYAAKASFIGGNSGLLKEWSSERGDFTTPEQHIPDTGMDGVDWETCMTMNTGWGFNQFDHNWKSSKVLIQNLVDVVSKGGNYLLNIGPKADGTIPPESIERMKAIGAWMDVNGDAIYGTVASPFEKPAWGRYTAKPHRLYAHVFDWPAAGTLAVASGNLNVTKAYLLADGKKAGLRVEKTADGLALALPAKAPDAIASVIVLEHD